MSTDDDLILDLDDVIMDAHGQVESMTDPETGDKVTADPKPAAKPTSGTTTVTYDELEEATDADSDPDGESTTTKPTSRGPAGSDEYLQDALAAYGFEDDSIQWNGEETRVRDLSPEDRREFFEQLREQDRQEALGLSEDEANLLNYVRQGGDLRDLVGGVAGDSQVAALDADALNRLDIRQQFPNLSQEEVEQELEDRKAGRLYESKTNALRDRLSQQEQQQAQTQAAEAFRAEQQQFRQAAEGLQAVLGFPVAPEVRQYLLQQTATQTENGQSPFLDSLTPEKILRLQFLDTYAEQMQQHYEGQIKEARKQGRREALEGAPSTPPGRAGGAGNVRGSNTNGRQAASYADYTLGAD